MDVKTKQLTDNELIIRYREGDASCFEALLERYQAKVYGYIFSVVSPMKGRQSVWARISTTTLGLLTIMR